jgi:hydroxyacylglutathione hydrolase
MKELAPGVWQLDGWPSDLVNVYLAGDVLIDAGIRQDAGRILRQLSGRPLSAHALTHAHPDHLGSSHALCEQRSVPFWVGERDAAAAADPAVLVASLRNGPLARVRLPVDPLVRLFVSAQAGSGQPVARTLREGDEVGGFQVLDTPGHSPGHIAFWRERDRVLIAGDVVWNFQFVAGKPGMTLPPAAVNSDSAQNRESARRLAALEPRIVCFGHGPVLHDGARFVDFVSGIPT